MKVKSLHAFLLAALLVACTERGQQTASIEFSPRVQQQQLHCNEMLLNETTWQLEQLWFYASDFQWQGEAGWQPLALVDNLWQQQQVALIGRHCDDNKMQNWQVVFAQELIESAKSLKFKIAVPFSLNHQNPLQAEGIFDNANMFWTWQQGYKSFRFDIKSDEQGWAYHLGAVGCHSPSVVRAPQQQCRQPNHLEVTITDFKPAEVITIDIMKIVKDINLSHATRCLSMPTQRSCYRLMSNMKNQESPVFSQRGQNEN